MIVIALQTLVAIIGLLIYLLAAPTNSRALRVGEIMFFCGLFAICVFSTPLLVKFFAR